ncbi:hypothetical protein PIB30_025451 [Stylosanthes scabra]|uniref:Uncharacterized protein n=1 Tax=Stylosanthes scabra TaxID=79078 RepID=A0ABU6UC42_9FABA|nr:hypothetical protein [Stylosanthes scabra]
MSMDKIVLGTATKSFHVNNNNKGIIGVVAGNSVRSGKEEIVGIEIALEDFYHYTNRRFALHIRDSHGDPLKAALSAAHYAARTVALAMSQTNKNEGGQFLMNKILHSNFLGQKGRIQFHNHTYDPTNTFQIINVIGKEYKEIGCRSSGLGFSSNIGEHEASYNSSMKELEQVMWPGRPWETPIGWALPTVEKQFINITQCQFEGFTIDLFKATVELMPYHVPYKFYAFNDTYDELVRQIYLKDTMQIYGALFMNILGFVVISILIYVRDITWEFPAEVLVVAIVCALMGIAASFRHTVPLWTSTPAYLLLLLSFLFVFVLKDVLNYV